MPITGDYDLKLVILSIIVAIISSGLFINLSSRGVYSEKNKTRWFFIGAVVIGLGIWSTHFIGMLAYQINEAVYYNFFLMIVSFILAVISSFLALEVVSRPKDKLCKLLLGGFLIGIAMIFIHFIGMAAMDSYYAIQYNVAHILLSILVSVVFSFLSLWFLVYFQNSYIKNTLIKKVLSSIIMGSGISSMHYIAMGGVSFYCTPKETNHPFMGSLVSGFFPVIVSSDLLAYGIGFTTLIILFITIFIAYYDRYESLKLKKLIEQHYRSLVDYNPYLALTVNLDGVVTHVNPKGAELLGCSADEIISTSFFSYFRKEDYERVVEAKFQAAKKGHGCSFECDLVNKDGNIIRLHFTFVPIVSDHQSYGVFVVGQDMSELIQYKKRIEKAQRDLWNTVRQQQGMIFKFLKKGDTFIHTLCDGELLYKIGYTPKDVIGKSLRDFFPKDITDEIVDYYEKAWSGEIINFEAHVNGIVYLASLRPVKRNGKVMEVIGSAIDITDRKNMEQAIILAKEEAEKANKAKSEIISKMSHELRTPLNGILGFAQLLEIDNSLTEQQKEFVEKILSGGRHLLNLVNEILDLSRIETGKLKLSFDYVKLEPIIDESIKLIQPLAEEKKIRIIKKLDKNGDDYIYTDPVRFRQIMLNLLSNAVKYNRENGVVMISSKHDHGNIYIHVQDSGIGIAKEEWEKIFNPFYRIKGTYVDGTGIGLSLVKQLVQLMGGEVGMHSALGEGSDFWFSLPVAVDVYTNDIYQKESKKNQEIKLQGIARKILYIEDNVSNLQLMKKILEPYPNITLLLATNGQEGIEFALNEKIDLILLDINLPDMSGYEVFEVLQQNEITKAIPVIAISAYAMKDEIQKALKIGFIDYLTKPIDMKQLLMKIGKVLKES
jgi:PAS domain S-box-containing protein